MAGSTSPPACRERLVLCLVVAGTVGIAVLGARPYAGGWNDGSRLATVETLVDQHTWVINDSVFVRVPSPQAVAAVPPYDPAEPGLLQHGTLDKLYINGHYYSDKSPVPALLMAGCYRVWQFVTGWTARQHPTPFCRAMTLLSSGLAYVVSVVCIYLLGRPLRLAMGLRLLLTASFGLATVALPYVQHVNNHVLLLGVMAALVLAVARFVEGKKQGRCSWRRSATIGALAGLAYTIDLGVGPVILLCTAALMLSCCLSPDKARQPGEISSVSLLASVSPCLVCGLAALPWLVLHHAINYSIGGSFAPANANPDYFCWPGSPFHVQNLTGSWIHKGLLSFVVYAVSMLMGKRGFIGHNLPLFLTLPALITLLRYHRDRRRELLWASGCCVGTWLLYAATSNNSSGQCCSIRWFVPLLAPAYYVLALFLRNFPRYRMDFLILSGWGLILVSFMTEGPWIGHMVPFFWQIQGAALCSWGLWNYLRPRSQVQPLPGINAVWNRLRTDGSGGQWRWQSLPAPTLVARNEATTPPTPAHESDSSQPATTG